MAQLYKIHTHTHTHSNNKEHIHTELLLDWRARGVALCFRLSVFFFFCCCCCQAAPCTEEALYGVRNMLPANTPSSFPLLLSYLSLRVFYPSLSFLFLFFFYFRFFFYYFAHPAMLSSAVTKCVSSRQLRCLVKLLFSFSCFHNYCILPRLQSTRLLFFFFPFFCTRLQSSSN